MKSPEAICSDSFALDACSFDSSAYDLGPFLVVGRASMSKIDVVQRGKRLAFRGFTCSCRLREERFLF